MPYKDESVRKSKNKEYSRKDYEGNYAKRRQALAARKKELKQEGKTKISQTMQGNFVKTLGVDTQSDNVADAVGIAWWGANERFV